MLALLGPNGAGKTTTVEICEGFLRRDAGEVRVLGLDPATQHERLRPRIGVMPQGGGAYPGVRAEEMLALVAACAANPLDPAWLIDVLGLGSARRTPYKRLSGGQQQRLSLACALVGAAGAGVPRRADRRHGPAGPASGVGAGAGAAGRRRERPADHPRDGGGRGAGRPRRDHRPRPGRRRGQPGPADDRGAGRRAAAVPRAGRAGPTQLCTALPDGLPHRRSRRRARTCSPGGSTRRWCRR